MFDTSETDDTPCVTQLTVFLQNRVGALMSLTRELEAQQIRICALSIIDAADHAVARLVIDKPTLAASSLAAADFHLFETDLLAVRLKSTVGGQVRRMLQALLLAEMNIDYVYPLVAGGDDGRPVMALHVEDIESGARCLAEQGFDLLCQDDLLI